MLRPASLNLQSVVYPCLNILGRTISSIIGIETSCDDTGVALIDILRGDVIVDRVVSQTELSVMLGGVLPTVASTLHRENIDKLTQSVLLSGAVSWQDIEAIAVTVQPGMPLSLKVGVSHAKQLAELHRKPLIPIHHMEAHALTSLLTYPSLTFPYLVLLVSGGHGLLALARGLEDFCLLGSALDASPGDVLDKIARRLKLARLGEPCLKTVCGGRAIEIMAVEWAGNPRAYELPLPRAREKDCDFSFTGIHIATERIIERLEGEHLDGTNADSRSVLPINCLADICASVLFAMTRHIARRVQRAIEFTRNQTRLQDASLAETLLVEQQKVTSLVVSGGVASNAVLRAGLSKVSKHYDMELISPPPHLCTDNGVMVAWNGLLHYRAGSRLVYDPATVDFNSKAAFGVDCRTAVRQAAISIDPIKLSEEIFRIPGDIHELSDIL